MNTPVRQFSNSRWFQIGMLAALAVALMIGAAYFFGTGLRADTAKSVAASPLGSSLSNVRESSSVAASPLGSSLTAVRESRLDDYYGRFTNSSAAANSASLVALAKSRSDFYADLNNSAAADPYQNEWMGFKAPESVEIKPSAIDQYQNEWMGFTLPGSVEVKPSAPDQYHFQWRGLTVP